LPAGTRLRWSQPGQFHLTAKFLGEFEGARLRDLVAASGVLLADFGAVPFEVGAPVLFPDLRHPIAIAALASDPEKKFAELAALLDSAMASFGVERERRAFRPHLTFARLKSGRLPRGFLPKEALGTCRADEVTLYESELRPEGALYRVVARFPLTTSRSGGN
jgi:2'-5' RNA ligase